MTQLYASVAIGTTATVLAIILVLVRVKFNGRLPVLALTRRWVATGARTSALILALLTAVAAFSFARIPPHELHASTSASAFADESSSDAKALQDLQAYAETIDAKQPSELPDVDTMIAKLLTRLEKEPGNVQGWKMLGWSYLNMDRAEEAVKAYEAALKLEPSDIEIKKGLEAAKSAKTVKTQTAPSDPSPSATSPAAQVAVEGQSAAQADSMIRSMVDQLAKRLETSPNDEDGWLRLMRARMTLGEKDAAKAALTKSLDTFASDAAAIARLTAAARDLGVGSK